MLRPTIGGGENGFYELISRPNMPVSICWTVRNTDTLLKTHPVEFRVLSEELLRFSRVSVRILVQPISFPRRFRFLIVRTGARNHGSLLIFWQKSECPQNWQHGQSEKRKITPESPRKTTESILKSLRVFLTVPPSKTLFFGKNLSSWSPKQFPTIDGLN